MEKLGASSARKSLKRKLEQEFGEDRQPQPYPLVELMRDVKAQVSVLNSALSSSEADRAAAKRAVHVLTEFAKNGDDPLISFSIPVI